MCKVSLLQISLFFAFLSLIVSGCGSAPRPSEPKAKKAQDEKVTKVSSAANQETPSKNTPKGTTQAETKAQKSKESAKSTDIKEVGQASEGDLKESYILLLQAQDILHQGDLETAQQILSQVTHRTPEIVEAHYNLGIIAERSGLPQQAREYYNQALKQNPSFTPALMAIVRFSLRQNDPKGAFEWVTAQLKTQPKNIALRNAQCRLRLLLNFSLSAVIKDTKAILREDE